MNRLILFSALPFLFTFTACAPDSGSVSSTAASALVGGAAARTEPDLSRSMVILSLYTKDTEEFVGWCGGAIISNELILTSAHCLRLGEGHNRKFTNDQSILVYFSPQLPKASYSGRLLRFAGEAEFRVEPGWKGSENDKSGSGTLSRFRPANDIALIRVKSIPPSYKPLPLIRAQLTNGTPVVMAGYGPDESHIASGIWDLTFLKTEFVEPVFPLMKQLTVKTDAKHTNIAGDSGSPGFIHYQGGNYIWGVCSNTDLDNGRAAYEPVATHVDWILSAARDLGVKSMPVVRDF